MDYCTPAENFSGKVVYNIDSRPLGAIQFKYKNNENSTSNVTWVNICIFNFFF